MKGTTFHLAHCRCPQWRWPGQANARSPDWKCRAPTWVAGAQVLEVTVTPQSPQEPGIKSWHSLGISAARPDTHAGGSSPELASLLGTPRRRPRNHSLQTSLSHVAVPGSSPSSCALLIQVPGRADAVGDPDGAPGSWPRTSQVWGVNQRWKTFPHPTPRHSASQINPLKRMLCVSMWLLLPSGTAVQE